jgi:septal ring factor EnvC (AmiA/AmiB activator)
MIRPMSRTVSNRVLPQALAAMLALAVSASGDTDRSPETRRRLRSMQEHIVRLEGELRDLEGREQGVLGELERLGAELRLRRAQVQEVDFRLSEVQEGIRSRTRRLESLERQQEERKGYLSFRLREVYKQGPDRALRRSVSGGDVESFLGGLRYAAFLSARDARILRQYRKDEKVVLGERERLLAERENLSTVRRESNAASRALQRSRESRSMLLESVRQDKDRRKRALEELESASLELAGLVGRLESTGDAPSVDMEKFKGLLDMPVLGEVTARFGKVVHPRFKTVVPHPGLDIEADEGEPFRSIFDGRIAFSAWLRGYGLTVIVDHGGGLLSIYAHASVLIVEEGEEILRGQKLGLVGDTGSLKGPFLYLELRRHGKPIDPLPWFR